ncbi:MAG: hypothetical protein O2960_07080 [Verrucomicrobia bacterium]|nr:hypothetical protein [Verrucomicrobiota bacterium]
MKVEFEIIYDMPIENPMELDRDGRRQMRISDIKRMRDRAPFRAFQLHLTNGETLPVRHPEYLAAPPEAGSELFVVWVGPDWNLVDAGQVARVSLLDGKTGKTKTR